MDQGPVSPDPGRDEDPGDLDLGGDPEDDPPPDVGDDELVAGAEEFTAEQARVAAVLAGLGQTAAMAAVAATASGSGDAGVRGELPGGVRQPGVGVRVG